MHQSLWLWKTILHVQPLWYTKSCMIWCHDNNVCFPKKAIKLNHSLTPCTWWRHQMETSSALLAICVGNSPVPGEFPAQRPVTRSFYVFFDLRLNKWLSKQSWGWWFEMLSRPLWCHCNDEWQFFGYEWDNASMIFTSNAVISKNHQHIASLVMKIAIHNNEMHNFIL